MFCMVVLLDFAEGTIPSTRPGRSLSGDVRTAGHGPAGNLRGHGVARAALAQGNTARAGVGVAGRKPNGLRGLSVEGKVPQPDHRGRNPSRQVQTDLIRQCQAQGEPSRKGRKGSPRPLLEPPAPLISCRAGSARVRQTHCSNRSTRGLARKMWRAPTDEPGGVLWETGTDRRRSFGVKRCGWR